MTDPKGKEQSLRRHGVADAGQVKRKLLFPDCDERDTYSVYLT